MGTTRIWSLWKSNQRYLCSGARPCVSLPRLRVTSVRQSSIWMSLKWHQSDLNSRWTPMLACLCGIFRPPPGVVGSRSFPTLRWNTDFSGYKNLWNFSASKQLCVVWCTCQQSFWGRIVVFPRINMFSGQNSAASLRTGRPNIEIFVETEVLGLASEKNIDVRVE